MTDRTDSRAAGGDRPAAPIPPIPAWQKALAVLYLTVAVVCVVVFRDRLHADFWPLDSSRVGPNLVASAVVGAGLVILTAWLYPPWRRATRRFFDHRFGAVHARVDEIHGRHDEHEQQLESIRGSLLELHEKIDRAQPKPRVARARSAKRPKGTGS